MIQIKNVLTGEVKASKEIIVFKSAAIGSCIVIAAYDNKNLVSAMAHVLLPGSAPKKSSTKKTRYAYNAIEEMIDSMVFLGANKENIEVFVVGGSNVLKRDDDTICQANINSVLKILLEKQIKVRGQSLGGIKRRSILFETKTGNVYHSIGNENENLLGCFIREKHTV